MSRGMKMLNMLNIRLKNNNDTENSELNYKKDDCNLLDEALENDILIALDIAEVDTSALNLSGTDCSPEKLNGNTSVNEEMTTKSLECDKEENNNQDLDSSYEPSDLEERTEEETTSSDSDQMVEIEEQVLKDEQILLAKKRKFSNIKRDSKYKENKRKREVGLPYNGKRKCDGKCEDKVSKTSDVVLTMDMQSVLLAPKNKVGAMYYKTKLAVHNFTIYNIKTHEAYCFLWNETEGALTANEFSSILVNFIEKDILPYLPDKSSKIIFWSDGCSGQNRNACLSNALLNSSINHQVTIVQKYLFKGHTQMEADSMHSAIERRLRNIDINVPADYVMHCQNARQKPFPYKVQYLYHTFFKDFSKVKYIASIRPGRKVGDPTVNEIKQIKYTADGLIEYKLRHKAKDWSKLDLRRSTKNHINNYDMKSLPALYQERRKIKKEKYDHLQILKNSLASDYHAFYDTIPFTTK